MKSGLTTLMFCFACACLAGDTVGDTIFPAEKSMSEFSEAAKDDTGDKAQEIRSSTSDKSSAPLPYSRGQDRPTPGLLDRHDFTDNPASKMLQGGDDISDAVIITGIPFIDSGTTEGYTDDYRGTCGYDENAPDVVYAYTPDTSIAIDISLCSSPMIWDTRLYVFEVSPDVEIACNDEGCSSLSSLRFVQLRAGITYYIVVDGVEIQSGPYVITVKGHAPCNLEIPPDVIEEGEPQCGADYIDTYNGGCNSEPSIFQEIPLNVIIKGTSGTYVSDEVEFRDTDWFAVSVDQPSTLTLKVAAEFSPLAFIIDPLPEGCLEFTLLRRAIGDVCDTLLLTEIVPVGTYWLWIGPSSFSGWPCPLTYVAWVNVEPYFCNPEMEIHVPGDLPFAYSGTTCGHIDDFHWTCLGNYYSGDDILFGLTVDSSIMLDLTLDPHDTPNTGFLIDDDCPPSRFSCIASESNPDTGAYGLSHVQLEAGTCHILVDLRQNAGCIGAFDLSLSESEPFRRGDRCEDPFIIPESFPFTDSNNTCDFGDQCQLWRTNNKDVIYEMELARPYDLTISLCGSDYDTKLGVFAGNCCSGPGSELYLNDDQCGVQSEILGHFDAGIYYVVVDGFSFFCGDYILRVFETVPCVVQCPPDALPEDEPDCFDGYIDDFNYGCASNPPSFSPIELGQQICGRGGTYYLEGIERRDFDYYSLALQESTLVKFNVISEFPVSIFAYDAGPGDCTGQTFLGCSLGTVCDATSLTLDLQSGLYWISIVPTPISGWPCGLTYLLQCIPLECRYFAGDINGDSLANGLDVTYGVIFFKGGGAPAVDCSPPCMAVPDPFYAAGDVNGDCRFNGVDITFYVAYLKRLQPSLKYCENCLPGNR
ncbi:MAG: hypothetical protein A2W25_10470 [candidate division Zixibacteria bacterium RBG_16_53_22]|nr:MAG: hypothetical protein A2W25_10470 [candidate division Zixibacteria bacterium RBG_16_53_22]